MQDAIPKAFASSIHFKIMGKRRVFCSLDERGIDFARALTCKFGSFFHTKRVKGGWEVTFW